MEKLSKKYNAMFVFLQIPSAASSRPISPSSSAALRVPGSRGSSFLPVDFTVPASPLGCLDTSAARHRIAINPRKQKGFTNKNQQAPVSLFWKRITVQKKAYVIFYFFPPFSFLSSSHFFTFFLLPLEESKPPIFSPNE